MIYLIITILLVVLELGYFRVAQRFNIIDKPNLRSSHTFVTLRGGGIIFLFAIWLYACFYGLDYKWFLLGVTLAGTVSFVDDIKSLPDSVRLVVQFVAMFLIFYQLNLFTLHDLWILPIALIVCVGIVNAYNFMDGINGITGGYSLAVLAPLIYLNIKHPYIEMSLLYVAVLALLVFCFFNFRGRARCFAGDVGSITIAYIIIFILGKLMLQTGNFAYIVFIAMYGADTILTICHRIRLRENLGEAHRKHAFQIMANELKIKHIYVSLLYMGLQLAISFGLIFAPINHYLYLGIVVVILLVAYLLFMKKYYHLHAEYLKSKLS